MSSISIACHVTAVLSVCPWDAGTMVKWLNGSSNNWHVCEWVKETANGLKYPKWPVTARAVYGSVGNDSEKRWVFSCGSLSQWSWLSSSDMLVLWCGVDQLSGGIHHRLKLLQKVGRNASQGHISVIQPRQHERCNSNWRTGLSIDRWVCPLTGGSVHWPGLSIDRWVCPLTGGFSGADEEQQNRLTLFSLRGISWRHQLWCRYQEPEQPRMVRCSQCQHSAVVVEADVDDWWWWCSFHLIQLESVIVQD